MHADLPLRVSYRVRGADGALLQLQKIITPGDDDYNAALRDAASKHLLFGLPVPFVTDPPFIAKAAHPAPPEDEFAHIPPIEVQELTDPALHQHLIHASPAIAHAIPAIPAGKPDVLAEAARHYTAGRDMAGPQPAAPPTAHADVDADADPAPLPPGTPISPKAPAPSTPLPAAAPAPPAPPHHDTAKVAPGASGGGETSYHALEETPRPLREYIHRVLHFIDHHFPGPDMPPDEVELTTVWLREQCLRVGARLPIWLEGQVEKSAHADLYAWQRKAAKAFKGGKSPNVLFKSASITPETHDAIQALLADAVSLDDIYAVFATARED